MPFTVHSKTIAEYGHNLPTLFRYIAVTYIDRFFEEGTLQLTTYERCKSLEDAARRDVDDGKQQWTVSDGNYVVAGLQTVGRRSYLFCTSLRSDITHFTDRTCFAILDPIGFADAVACAIPTDEVGLVGRLSGDTVI